MGYYAWEAQDPEDDRSKILEPAWINLFSFWNFFKKN